MLRHMSQERRPTHIEAYDLREKIHLSYDPREKTYVGGHELKERTIVEEYGLREKRRLEAYD